MFPEVTAQHSFSITKFPMQFIGSVLSFERVIAPDSLCKWHTAKVNGQHEKKKSFYFLSSIFFHLFGWIFVYGVFFLPEEKKNGQLWREVGWCDISISETFSLVRLVPSYHFIYVIFRRLIK